MLQNLDIVGKKYEGFPATPIVKPDNIHVHGKSTHDLKFSFTLLLLDKHLS